MNDKGIRFLLVQIDEAHSTKWPVGLKDTPEPHKDFGERVARANAFVSREKPPKPFQVLIDGWDNAFGNNYQAWPDKYYCIDSNYKILSKSTYGARGDALVDSDCTEIIKQLASTGSAVTCTKSTC
jgi:hypothetical protein